MFWFQTVEFQLMLTEMNDDVNQSFSWQKSTQPIMNCRMAQRISLHARLLRFRGFYPLCCDGFLVLQRLCVMTYVGHVNQSCEYRARLTQVNKFIIISLVHWTL